MFEGRTLRHLVTSPNGTHDFVLMSYVAVWHRTLENLFNYYYDLLLHLHLKYRCDHSLTSLLVVLLSSLPLRLMSFTLPVQETTWRIMGLSKQGYKVPELGL